MGGGWNQFKSKDKGANLFFEGYLLWKYLDKVGSMRNKDLATHFNCVRAKPSRFLAKGYRFGIVEAEYRNDNMKEKWYFLTEEATNVLHVLDEFLGLFDKQQIVVPKMTILNGEGGRHHE